MRDREYFQNLVDDLFYDYVYGTLVPDDDRILELSDFLSTKMTADRELNHLVLKDYYFIVNFFCDCNSIDENIKYEFFKNINYSEELYVSIKIINNYRQIIDEDIILSQQEFEKMYQNVRACFGNMIPLDFANYYFKHVLNEDYKITDKENYKFCIKLLIEEILKTKGDDFTAYIAEKNIGADGRYYFNHKVVVLGNEVLNLNINTRYTNIFNTIFHEIRHGFIDRSIENKEISYKLLQIIKENVLKTVNISSNNFNYQYQKDEIDARIYGQAMAYNYIKQLCPLKAKEMLKINALEFSKAKKDGEQNLRKVKKNERVPEKNLTLDEAFDNYAEKNNDVITMFPILELEYVYDDSLKKYRKKTSSEILIEKHEALEQIKSLKEQIIIESENNILAEKQMRENPRILLQTADVFGMKRNLSYLYKTLNVYNGLLNKRILSFKNLIKEYKDLKSMQTDNQEIKKEKELLMRRVLPKKFFQLFVNYGKTFAETVNNAIDNIYINIDNFINNNLSR